MSDIKTSIRITSNTWATILFDAVKNYHVSDQHFAVGRTIIALGQMTLIIFTAPAALFVPLQGVKPAPHCDGLAVVSLYCIGPGAATEQWRRIAILLILSLVVSGYWPRIISWLHVWVSLSIAVSTALPDGGDSLALVVTPLVALIAIGDNRNNQWSLPTEVSHNFTRAVSYAALIVLRIQLGYLYLNAGISKMGSSTWSQGSAEYYFMRDVMFGASGFLGRAMLQVTTMPLVSVAFTWGGILIEIAIGVAVLLGVKTRKFALGADIFFHGFIILTMGLWSFGLIAIGSMTIATGAFKRSPSERHHMTIKGSSQMTV